MSCERLRIFYFTPMTLHRRKPILYTYSVKVGFLTVISFFCSFFSMSMFSSCTDFTSHCILTSGTRWLLYCSGTQNRRLGLGSLLLTFLTVLSFQAPKVSSSSGMKEMQAILQSSSCFFIFRSKANSIARGWLHIDLRDTAEVGLSQ